MSDRNKSQTKIKVYLGLEWLCLELVREVANTAATLACLMIGVAEWEEWSGEESAQMPRRSEKEEKFLWKMLRDLDIESAREEKRASKKKARVVAAARKKMGVSKKQPSIKDALKVASVKESATPVQGLTCSSRSGWKSSQGANASEVSGGVLEPSQEGKPLQSLLSGGGVNTLTGSVRVAASQSNTVTPVINPTNSLKPMMPARGTRPVARIIPTRRKQQARWELQQILKNCQMLMPTQ